MRSPPSRAATHDCSGLSRSIRARAPASSLSMVVRSAAGVADPQRACRIANERQLRVSTRPEEGVPWACSIDAPKTTIPRRPRPGLKARSSDSPRSMRPRGTRQSPRNQAGGAGAGYCRPRAPLRAQQRTGAPVGSRRHRRPHQVGPERGRGRGRPDPRGSRRRGGQDARGRPHHEARGRARPRAGASRTGRRPTRPPRRWLRRSVWPPSRRPRTS